MRLSAILAAALATLAAADSVHFTNLDSVDKTIYFTGNDQSHSSIELPANGEATWTASPHWVGNFYSINKGAANVPGMLGEINFADAGTVWYDVSAIVNAKDNDGVKQLWAKPEDPISGCESYAAVCPNAYNLPDDIQTKSTSSRDLFCSVGIAPASKIKMARAHARDFLSKIRNAL